MRWSTEDGVDRGAHYWLDVFCEIFCGLFSSCAICSARGYYRRAYVRSSERSVYLKSCEAISLAVVCLSPGGSGPGTGDTSAVAEKYSHRWLQKAF